MNYIQFARFQLSKRISVEPRLLDLYTLLVLTKGDDCTLKDVHDAWAVWTDGIKPDHSSLIPFQELPGDIQELDREYAEAIIKTAQSLRTIDPKV